MSFEKYNRSFFKYKFFRIIFSKRIIFVIAVILQLLVMKFIYDSFKDAYNYLYGIYYLINILIIIYIVNRDENPIYKLAWIIPVIGMPIFGPLLYLFVRLQFGTKVFAKKIDTAITDISEYNRQDFSVIEEFNKIAPQKANLANYVSDSGGFPVYKNSSLKYFKSGEDKLKQLLVELEAAEKYIFLEYFIIQQGVMWGAIEEVLFRKVKEGVEVRLMYDGTNSLVKIPSYFPDRLRAHGIKVKVFNPIKPFLATYQNNRDHRKIVVIDGHTAFTGGVNLADEYINEKELFGHWKDTAIMVKGESVRNFTAMFLQMWNITDMEEDIDEKFFSDEIPVPEDAEGFVINYSDSPMDNESVGENVYLDIIYKAKKYVYITTPYLILDSEMESALVYAAKSGIDVRIVLPHIPDKKYAFLLARNHYKLLISSGVKIYEYTPGFIHAKMFLCDDIEAVVGTINLDFRSLYLHFECATYVYGNPVINDIKADFLDIFDQSELVTKDMMSKYSVFDSLCGKILRIFAPLM